MKSFKKKKQKTKLQGFTLVLSQKKKTNNNQVQIVLIYDNNLGLK